MKKISVLMLGAASLAMVSCQKTTNEVAADNVEANAGNMADNLDAAASNMSDDATKDSLKKQADQIKDKGDAVADNVASGNMTESQGNATVNAM